MPRRELALPLGDFSVEALRGAAGGSPTLDGVTRQALYYYLADRDGGRAAWPYPRFMKGDGAADAGEVTVAIEVDDDAWEAFAREAAEQQVSPERLLGHAVLYFAADVEAGRVARRVLDQL